MIPGFVTSRFQSIYSTFYYSCTNSLKPFFVQETNLFNTTTTTKSARHWKLPPSPTFLSKVCYIAAAAAPALLSSNSPPAATKSYLFHKNDMGKKIGRGFELEMHFVPQTHIL